MYPLHQRYNHEKEDWRLTLTIGNIGIGNISTLATLSKIAESKPSEKEMMVNLVMTFLA